MTIKEVEQQVDMKKANIRYYEEEGLLTPQRNKTNNYRDYSMADVEDLKKIKFLRLLDVPVKDIKKIKEGRATVTEVMRERKALLLKELKELAEVEQLCDELIRRGDTFEQLDVTLIDLQSGFFKMRGAKIMRLDKIYRLESYRKVCVRIWQTVFLLYYPVMLTLKLVMHINIPFWISAPLLIIALGAVAAMGVIDYRILHYKDETGR